MSTHNDRRPPTKKQRKHAPNEIALLAAAAAEARSRGDVLSGVVEGGEELKVKEEVVSSEVSSRATRTSVRSKRAIKVKQEIIVKQEDQLVKREEVAVMQETEQIGGWTGNSNSIAGPSRSRVPTSKQVAASIGLVKEEFTAASKMSGPLEASSEAPSKGKARATAKAKKVTDMPGEKRSGRMRVKAPVATLERMGRVMSQRMFMVDRLRIDGESPVEQFKVLGSTGNVYTVVIGSQPRCDCPDCMKGNVPCKHIIFVFLKVLKVPSSSTVWYQKALLASELQAVFAAAPPAPSEHVVVTTQVKTAYLRATGAHVDEEVEVTDEVVVEKAQGGNGNGSRKDPVGEDCPVCYEEMTEEDVQGGRLVFDESPTGCGKALHKQCFQMWTITVANSGAELTCVWCRTPWPKREHGGAGKGKGGVDYNALGYMNMADVMGISRIRDTSTYYQGPIRGRRFGLDGHERYADD